MWTRTDPSLISRPLVPPCLPSSSHPFQLSPPYLASIASLEGPISTFSSFRFFTSFCLPSRLPGLRLPSFWSFLKLGISYLSSLSLPHIPSLFSVLIPFSCLPSFSTYHSLLPAVSLPLSFQSLFIHPVLPFSSPKSPSLPSFLSSPLFSPPFPLHLLIIPRTGTFLFRAIDLLTNQEWHILRNKCRTHYLFVFVKKSMTINC